METEDVFLPEDKPRRVRLPRKGSPLTTLLAAAIGLIVFVVGTLVTCYSQFVIDVPVRHMAVLIHKTGKDLHYTIAQGRLSVERDAASSQREGELDGRYIIRTSEAAENLSAEDAVRQYKSLARVERAFRCLKGMDLRIRPIFHRTEDHVKAHIFLCLLAYYVEWHLREALAPLLFQDEELPMARSTRDPVAPAEPSDSARAKKRARQTQDGLPLHSFQTLLVALGTRCRNHCRVGGEPNGRTFTVVSEPTDLQRRALELLGLKA
jgi:hypothetical protein